MENSDAFFTLVCDCGENFSPDQDDDCPLCGRTEGMDMSFDVKKFLECIYECDDSDGIMIVLDAYFNLADRFDIMGEIYKQIDVTRIRSVSLMLSFLTNTFKYSSRLPEHARFYFLVRNELINMGKTEKELAGLLHGLENDNGYWDRMKSLGAARFMGQVPPEDE